MATAPDPLDALHAIRLPAPPASSLAVTLGFGAAAGLAAALLVAAAFALFARWRQRRAPMREALRALEVAAGLPGAERVCAQAAILRGYAAAVLGAETNRLQGGTWLERLDQLFATDFFTRGAGAIFGAALYRPLPDIDIAAMETTLRRLLRQRVP